MHIINTRAVFESFIAGAKVARERESERDQREMRSLQQQQQQGSLDVVRSSRGGGSNRIAAFDMEGDVPPFVDPDITTNNDKQFDHDEDPNHQVSLSFLSPPCMLH